MPRLLLSALGVVATVALALGAVRAGLGDSDFAPDAPSSPDPDPAAARTAAGPGSAARPSPSGARLQTVARVKGPTSIAPVPGERQLVAVTEQRGRVLAVGAGARPRTILDLRARVSEPGDSGERGLLSVALAPAPSAEPSDPAASGRDASPWERLYVFFTAPSGDLLIEEYRRRAGGSLRADPTSRRLVLRQRHRRYDNHNGGQLQLGPDGMLYAGLGDGGGAFDPLRSAQDRTSLLGSIVRIDPRPAAGRPYRIPPDNPFAGRDGVRPELYLVGLRNPWRFSFDRATGTLIVADVGQDRREEVNVVPRERAGANLGWSCFEGSLPLHGCRPADHRPPQLELAHERGRCSITGGYVVRDRGLERLYGHYVYGDFCSGRLRAARLRVDGARGDRPLDLEVPGLSALGEDRCARLYAASLTGRIHRLRGTGPSRCPSEGAER